MLHQQCSSMLSGKELSPEMANRQVLAILKKNRNNKKTNTQTKTQTKPKTHNKKYLFSATYVFAYIWIFYSLLLGFVEIYFYMPM